MGASDRFQILPDYRFPADLSLVPRETLKGQSTINETLLSVCALGEPLRFAYGLCQVGGQMLRAAVRGQRLYLPAIICRGEIDAINRIFLDGVEVPSTVEKHTYLGTASQAVDSWLQTAYIGAGIPYTDTLNGIAWAVLRFPPDYEGSVNNLVFEFRGMKVRHADGGAKSYSKNPAYWIADFIESAEYGLGRLLDWSTVPALADRNDELLGSGLGAERRAGGLVFDTRRDVNDVLETLRSYAGCFVVPEGDYIRLVPDAPAEPVFAFTPSNTKLDTIKIDGPKAKDIPTVVTVIWTNTRTSPWSEAPQTEYAPGVREGTTPWREEMVRMPGIQNASWARREALRRLNEYTVSDLIVNFEAFGEPIELRRGDVFTLSDNGGFDEKPFRLVNCIPKPDPGAWVITGKEYDPQVYSDAVAVEPTTPDTSFSTPTAPPTVTGLTLTEDVYTTPEGLTVRRALVDWDDAGYEYLLHYLVRVYEGSTSGQLIETKTPITPGVATGALQEEHTYAITVTVISRVAAGTPAESTILIGGTAVLPPDVTSLAQSVVGNVTRLSWAAASGSATAIELRWGATSLGTDTAAFNAATLLNRVAMPATAYETTAIPTGTWRVFAKFRDALRSAIYPLGRESENPAYIDVTIAGADGAVPPPAVVIGDDETISGSPTLVNMVQLPSGCWVTAMGSDTWNALFGSALDTYTDPIFSYHASGTSSLTTPSVDLGVPKTGTFVWSPDYAAISGTVSAYIETSLDGSAWTTQAAGLSYAGTARYLRGKVEALTTSTALVCSMGSVQVQVDGVAAAIAQQLGSLRKRKWQTVGAGSTAAVDDGFGATVTTGLTARNLDTSFSAGCIPYAAIVNGPTAGQSVNWRSRDLFLLGNAVGRGGFDVTIYWIYETAFAPANQRSFVGMRATGGADIGNVEPDTLTSMFGIGAKAGDANLSEIHNDGSGTATMATLGADFPARANANLYRLRLKSEPFSQSIQWFLTNLMSGAAASGTWTSDIPANTTPLGVVVWGNNGSTAASVAIGLTEISSVSPF